MAELLTLDSLTRYFELGGGRRVHAVDGISFGIAEREVLGLVGESGSGKSTLGKTLLGLYTRRPALCTTGASHCLRTTRPPTSAVCPAACR